MNAAGVCPLWGMRGFLAEFGVCFLKIVQGDKWEKRKV